MCLIMIRNKVGKEEWLLEALIVTMEFFLKSSSLENTNVITRSDGLRCAVSGMSEVRITSEEVRSRPKSENFESEKSTENKIPQISKLPRGQSSGREQSCPPKTGWRSRLLQNQEIEKSLKKDEKKQVIEKKDEKKQVIENKDEKKHVIENKDDKKQVVEKKEQRRSSKTYVRRKRLDTLNSESESENTSTRSRKVKRKIKVNSNSPPPIKKSTGTVGLR